jgi:tRNA 2-thiouridine synthesizing protein C
MKITKRFLFVIRRPPCDGVKAHEILDQVLTTAAFDQAVSLLFLDDGVFQLLRNQQADMAGLEPVTPLLEALPMYDVNALWVEQESLDRRGLCAEALAVPVRTLARSEVASLLLAQDVLIGC